ncbi:MAG: ATP-binding protein [Pseudomonadota bacterium]
MTFGILKKFLVAFLLLSLLPLIAVSIYTWNRMNTALDIVADSNRDSLINNSMSLLEARARSIATQVEQLLNNTVDDLNLLATLPVSETVYQQFRQVHQRLVWRRTGTRENPGEIRTNVPVYREVTFCTPGGVQTVCIDTDSRCIKNLDVSRPFQSAYGVEDYFNKAMNLPDSGIFVSHLNGYHVSRDEQLSGADTVENAYSGKSYLGIIRFAKAVMQGGKLAGVVSIALDHRHLMEFTQHVLPFGTGEIVFPSYDSGNYAFMFDDEGWMVTHPKYWDIRGIDSRTLTLIDPASQAYTQDGITRGIIPFNLLFVPFVHENYQRIAREVIAGKSGVRQTASVGGVQRILAYAPIHFIFGDYEKTGCFGGITLGAQTGQFLKTVDETSRKIDGLLKKTATDYILLIIITGVLVAAIAIVLANTFTRPIRFLTKKVKEISDGCYDVDVRIRTGDELEVLGQNVKEMGNRLKQHEEHLVRSLNDLEKHVDILKSIHSGSHMLTFSLDKEKIYDVILKTCVDGIGFKRAALFILDARQGCLVCVKAYGFSLEALKLLEDNPIPVEISPPADGQTAGPVTLDRCRFEDLSRRISATVGEGQFTCAPVTIAGGITGVLGVDLGEEKTAISDKKTESLQIIANEAGMAISRAMLLEESVRGREFIESILSNILSALIVFDSSGRILVANPKAQKFFDMNHDAILEGNIFSILEPYPEMISMLNNKSGKNEDFGTSLDLKLPGRKVMNLEVALSSLRGAPGIHDDAQLLIIRDLTERKNMEKHLSRSDKLVSLGVLAAGIAHEIRNPLTGITLMLDDLHDRMTNRTEDRLMIQRALEAIERLENIVTRLLEFASKPAHKPFSRNINHVIDDTLFFVKKQCTQQGVSLIKETEDPIPLVSIDQERIRQAILNIVLNALNVLKQGGEIRISTRFSEHPEALSQGSAVILSIADNGPGISKEDMNYIFDPFFSHNPDGFGLGLSITHTIVQEHGGKILVESEPGKGTCFNIYLPVG